MPGTEDTILETRGLTKVFHGFIAVDQVDFTVTRGTIHALIGPNGAGKTTLFNLITGFISPTAGEIIFKGADITQLHPADVASRGLVRSFQISAIFPDMTVAENIRIALQRKSPARYVFWRSDVALITLNAEIDRLADAVGLRSLVDVRADGLPYGRRRALELATTIALEPDMLLLDEPTAGMASEDLGQVIALIKKVAHGRTVLIVEHNLKVVAELSDLITVMQRGRIIAQGDYAHVSRDPEVRQAYLGTRHA